MKKSQRLEPIQSPILASVSSQTARVGHLSHRLSAARQLSRDTKKEMTRSTLRYRVDSSADHINSTAGTERRREGSYRSSDFTADIIMATGYTVDWDVLRACSESSRAHPHDEIHEQVRSDMMAIEFVPVTESPYPSTRLFTFRNLVSRASKDSRNVLTR